MKRVRMGMVGGGKDAFIGNVHRMAARLDGQIDLVCGAFSRDAKLSQEFGVELGLEPSRSYASWAEMLEKEKALPAQERMEFVSIVTPNFMHYPVAEAALKNGFHVMSDKPATFSLEEAQKLSELVEKAGLLYGLTHNYTGYPMVKEAKHLVREGKLGAIRRIVVEYPQGWLSTDLEKTGQKQADWRTDPKRAGISCCMGDIGTHAENLAEYITGLKIESLCADLHTHVSGRLLDDDGSVLLRFENGARGILYASRISVGEENDLKLRVYGETGGLEWSHSDPNTLILKHLDRPSEILRAGVNYANLSSAALNACRLPGGHPEGFLEAFANLYKNFSSSVDCLRTGKKPNEEMLDFPTISDGLRGMAFVDTVVKSSASEQKWFSLS